MYLFVSSFRNLYFDITFQLTQYLGTCDVMWFLKQSDRESRAGIHVPIVSMGKKNEPAELGDSGWHF